MVSFVCDTTAVEPGRSRWKRLRAPLLAGAGFLLLAATFSPLSVTPAHAASDSNDSLGQFDVFVDNRNPVRAPEINDPGQDAPINVQADRFAHDQDTGIVVATGDVLIEYGPYVLQADQVTYNPRNDEMTADGNVFFREPNGNVVRAQHMVLGQQFRIGFGRYLRLTLTNEAWILAQNSERLEGNINVFYDVTYSRCTECVDQNGNPLWVIHSEVVTHDQDEQVIYHKNATLEFMGVPVFYSPYLEHPDPTVNKRSGFLLPTIKASDELGVGFEVPYFWNIAPNYDLTLRPTFSTRQLLLMEADWRHRIDWLNGAYDISIAGVYQLNPSATPPGDGRFRGSIDSNGLFNIGDDWYWGWQVQVASDDTFLRAYEIDGRTDLVSQGFIVGLDDRNYFDARAIHFKGLLAADNNSTIPNALPTIRHSFYFDDPVFGGELSLDTHIYNLRRNAGADSSRVVSEVHWQRQFISDMGIVVTPFAGVRGDVYYTDNVPDITQPSGQRDGETTARVFPRAGVDIRMPFVSNGEFAQQIFEPVAQIIVATNETDTNRLPNEDSLQFEFDATNVFLLDKFNGIDRYEGGTRANIGFNHTVLLEDGAFIRATVGETFHIAGDNSFSAGTGLDTYRSDFVAGIAFQPIANVRIASLLRFDEKTFAVRRHDLTANLFYEGLTVAANYTDLSPAVASGRLVSEEQISASASYRLADYWQVFGNFRYDIQEDARRSQLAGLRFLCECFTAELVYKETFVGDRDADPDRSIVLNVLFTTLGGGSYNQDLD